MNHLYRELAPVPSAAWEEIESQAQQALKATLGARKVVDFAGPLGWETCAVDLGRSEPLAPPLRDGVEAGLRQALPLVELRAPFDLPRREIEAIARGAKDADLSAAGHAARAIAVAEDSLVFQGYGSARIPGLFAEAATKLTLTDDYLRYPEAVAEALFVLRNAGVGGPYGIVLGPRCYTGLTKTTTAAGFPVMRHVVELLDGPVVPSNGLDGAVVLSLRGGDFELTVGQDFSIGYLSHTDEKVRLCIQETITFRVLDGDAAIPLVYGEASNA